MKKSKLEKILWACLIVMFFVGLIGTFVGKHMAAGAYYRISLQMSAFAIVVISLERFYIQWSDGTRCASGL